MASFCTLRKYINHDTPWLNIWLLIAKHLIFPYFLCLYWFFSLSFSFFHLDWIIFLHLFFRPLSKIDPVTSITYDLLDFLECIHEGKKKKRHTHIHDEVSWIRHSLYTRSNVKLWCRKKFKWYTILWNMIFFQCWRWPSKWMTFVCVCVRRSTSCSDQPHDTKFLFWWKLMTSRIFDRLFVPGVWWILEFPRLI